MVIDVIAAPKAAGRSGSRSGARAGAGAVEAPRDQRRRQLEERLAAGRSWIDPDLVVANRTGGALDSRNVTKSLQAALVRAGLPHQRFHDPRHAYATLRIEAGAELVDVSRNLGHADLWTTRTCTRTSRETCSAARRSDGRHPRGSPRGCRELTGVRTGVKPGNTNGPRIAPGAVSRSDLWSGRSDSNARPPEPHSGALPGCATPRGRRV